MTAHEVEGSEEQLKLSSFSLRLSSECFTPTEPCDVTSKASTTSLFTFAQTVFNGQPPDIVIANAGVNEVGHLEDDVVLHNQHGVYPKKPGQITLDVNLSGAILTAEVARRAWKDAAQEPGHALARQRKLILISSMGGWEGIPMGTLYSMAKHGLLGYWVALAAEQERLKDDTFSYVVAIFSFSTWSLSHPASNVAVMRSVHSLLVSHPSLTTLENRDVDLYIPWISHCYPRHSCILPSSSKQQRSSLVANAFPYAGRSYWH